MSIPQGYTFIVTGGAGFIGSGFAHLCAKEGMKIIVLDALTYAGHRESLAALEKEGWVEFVKGDICDGPLARSLLQKYRPTGLINFAAESHVDRSIDSPSAFIETNIRGTISLLNASLEHWNTLGPAEKASFRFVQVSTDEVYGSLGETGKFTETTSLAPNSPYSASKAGADLLVRAWHHTYGLPTVTTNCSNNYGPRQFPEKLIPHMIHCALTDMPLPIYGDGKNIRDWIHVEDHCSGILLAARKGRPGETYCFGGDAERNNVEVVQTICKLLDELRPRKDRKSYSEQIKFVKDRLGHDRRYAIDDTKAQKELGFTRKYGFEKGLQDTVKWYLANDIWAASVLSSKEKHS